MCDQPGLEVVEGQDTFLVDGDTSRVRTSSTTVEEEPKHSREGYFRVELEVRSWMTFENTSEKDSRKEEPR